MFYFAWVDKADTTFDSVAHAREDEQLFNVSVQHSEGDFPALVVDIINPRIGLLAPTRKQWAWLSYRTQANDVVPLFFGRLVGVPEGMQDEVVRLNFVARPADYEEQRETLAASLRVAPFYDEVWLSDEERVSPDAVLEGRSALWHIDRVSHAVTISDILLGEDGVIEYGSDTVFYESVSVSFSESPARRAIVEAEVQWTQAGTGDVDITQKLLSAFASSAPLTAISGDQRPSAGVINIMGGDALISVWPQFGASIGGGWTVGESHASVVGQAPNPSTVLGNIKAAQWARMWTQTPHISEVARVLFDKTPGIIVQIEDTSRDPWGSFGYIGHGPVNFMWLPIWQVAASMSLHWEAERKRTERVAFEIPADVQPILTDPGEEETLRLSYGPADVDLVIGDVRRNRYFSTDRGKQSFENLLARARAHLLARARAVDVSFEVPFEQGLELSLRKSAGFFDPRLPGGVVAGKVKSYTLSADGDSGLLLCSLTIGATVGRNGTITAVPGTPTYVDDYVDTGYQVHSGTLDVPIAGDLGYGGLDDYAIDDDGVDLFNINARNYLTSLSVEGSLDVQKAAVQGETHPSGPSAVDRVSAVKTKVRLTTRAVTGGPFETDVVPTVTELKVPRSIDLEAGALPLSLAGNINSNPKLIGALTVGDDLSLAGAIDADPELTGALAVEASLAGAIDANPSLTGSLDDTVELMGAIDANPELTGAINVGDDLAGSIDANPALSGALAIESDLAGTIAPTPTLTGSLAVESDLAGAINPEPMLTGALFIGDSLAGSIDADPVLVGGLVVEGDLAGTIAPTPTLTGALDVFHALAGNVDANPALTGALVTGNLLAGTIAPTPTLTGAVDVSSSLAGTIAPTPTLTGALAVEASLAGTIAPTPTLTGALDVFHALAGKIAPTPSSAFAPRITRSTRKWAQTVAGVWTEFGPNVLARTDKGLSVEPFAETLNAYNDYSSVSLGVVASSNSGENKLGLPYAWYGSYVDFVREIISKDVVDGLPAITVKLSGTNSTGATAFPDFATPRRASNPNSVPAVSGESVSFRMMTAKRVSGSEAGFTDGAGRVVSIAEIGVGGNYLTGTTAPGNITTTAAERKTVRTFNNALAAYAAPFVAFSTSAGGTVDITVQLGLLELRKLGAGVNITDSPIVTNGPGTTTRAADVVVLPFPAGTHNVTVTFDDNSTQSLTGQAGGDWTIPTNLTRPVIKSIAINALGLTWDFVNQLYPNTIFGGGLVIEGSLAGTIAPTPTLTGDLNVSSSLAGAIDANPALTGALTVAAPPTISAQWLVQAGGGGSFVSAGGGGGLLESAVLGNDTLSTSTTYPVVVGPGGVSWVNGVSVAAQGSDSSFNGHTAVGGGKGQSNAAGGNGGSGGGGADQTGVTTNPGGTATSGQGNNGGSGRVVTGQSGAGGGGGAGGAGGNGASGGVGGNGGAGKSNSITGSPITFGAGGGGFGSTTRGSGGSSNTGGPAVLNSAQNNLNAPVAKTGSGAGGGGGTISSLAPGAGGRVIVRYTWPTALFTGGTVTTGVGGTDIVHDFDSVGSFNLTPI